MAAGLSRRLSFLKPSPTLTITAKAKELRAKGIDVIGFGAGEPDFDTPEFIKEACIKALKEGKTKYSPPAGIPELREAIAEKLLRENGVEYKPSEIVISSGAKMVLFLIFMAILDEGDEVLLPTPYWVTYPEQVRFFGGVPVEIHLSEESGFKLRLEDIKGKVSDRTKAIVINSPNNPTGAVYDEEELKKIAEFCVNRDIFIISDECYEHFTYGEERFVSVASLGEDVKRITFTVNAFSKTFSMTGWRIGYVACPEEFAKAIASLNSQSVSNVTTFAQYGALEALRNPESKRFISHMKETFRKRRDTAYRLLREIPSVSVVKPSGAFYLFPNFGEYSKKLGGDVKLSEYLLEEGKVATVPGSAFGMEGYLRLSFALSEEKLTEGINRIKETLSMLRK